jgi:hypothetical protein
LPRAEFTKRANEMTDAELSRTICAAYRRIVARNRGFKEQALRTCEAMLRIHRTTEGSTADRARIARMLAEETVGLPQPSITR